jgi:hypothetical protein
LGSQVVALFIARPRCSHVRGRCLSAQAQLRLRIFLCHAMPWTGCLPAQPELG